MKRFFLPLTLISFILINLLFGWYIPSFPKGLVWGTIILIGFLWIIIFLVTSLSLRKPNFYWQLVAPTLFFIAAVLFYIFFNTPYLQKIYWLLVSLALAVYLYNLWLFYKKPARYQAFTLENFSWYLHLASSFFLSSALYGFIIFINLPTFYVLLLIAIFCTLVFLQLWWIQKLDNPLRWWWLVAYITIGVESFVVFKMLPFSFYLLGFWWTGVWYILTSFIFSFLKENFILKKFITYTLIIFSLSLLLTLTARTF
jgi:hypothetical protein